MLFETEILTTKLHRPRSSGLLVPRRRLLQRLEEQRERPLTLVCAPAGYGKTTLISTWLEESEWPSAWLSLDDGDDDLGIFMTYVLAAIQTQFPRAVGETLALLGAVSAPPLSVLARSLSNELDQIDQPFVLALDDYHYIRDAAVHELLDELLTHPPRSLHLVLTSRVDPPLSLSRLRARHQMTEIRTADLRFDPEETAAFVEQEMRISVDERALGVLQQRVEGWAAGMRLIVLSLRQWGSVDLNPSRLRGHVQYVADYLASEVLKGQPQPIQDYLLSTSVLDRFTASLCDAVCLDSPGTVSEQGEQEPCSLDGQAFVAWLQENNLFITPLDDQGEWYRYHPLLREFMQGRLRQEFGPEGIALAHRRASRWFAENGLIGEAIHHALAAGETGAAVQLVAQHRHTLIDKERWRLLERWLRRFPQSVIDESPDLLMSEVWVLALQGRWEEIGPILGQVQGQLSQEALASDVRGQIAGEVDLFYCSLVSWMVDGTQMLGLADGALQRLPLAWEYARGLAVMFKGAAYHVLGEKGRAYETLFGALEDGRHGPSYWGRVLTGLCILHWADADLPALERAAKRFVTIGQDRDLQQSLTLGHYFLGCVYYERGQLSLAQEHLLAAYEARHAIPLDFLLQSSLALALTYEALGRSGEARQTLSETYEFFRALQNYRLVLAMEAARAELALRQGLLAEANRWAQSYNPYPLMSMHTFRLSQLTLVKLLLLQDTGASRKRAADVLDQVRAFAEQAHNVFFAVEALALQAWLTVGQGDEPTALELLERAVCLAEPGGSLRVFVDLGPRVTGLLGRLRQRGIAPDYIAAILAARAAGASREVSAQQASPAEAEGLVDPLTNRESEVLALLAQRLTNREIAARLFISPGTVRQHTHKLYRKLGVHNRREAVARARELGLLAPQRP